MPLKIKLNEDVRGVADLEVELQNLLPGLSDEDAHDYAKELWAVSKRGGSVSKRAGSTSKGVGPSVKIDGKVVPTVKIGTQTWTATNLAVDDGKGGITYNEENGEYYYTWEAAMRVAKSIPGWHLPSALEWNEAALACGATEKPYKDGSDPNLNNYEDAQVLKDKLGVKSVGCRYGGSFYFVGIYAYFWTATENSYYANSRYFLGASMDSYNDNKTNNANSVRLVKD